MLSTIIGVIIGLAFVYLLLSLLATWIQELAATLLSWRSKELVNVVQNLLDPSTEKLAGVKKLEQTWAKGAGTAEKVRTNFVKALYESPLVRGLSKPGKRPSYIPGREFGNAVFDLMVKTGTEASPALKGLEAFRRGVAELPEGVTREALLSFSELAEQTRAEVEGAIAAVRGRITRWFDAAMDRAAGWYKRRVQYMAIVVGVLLAVAFNADSIAMARRLWVESSLRGNLTDVAREYLDSEQRREAGEVLGRLEALGLPLGWGRDNLPAAPDRQEPCPAWRLAGWWLLRVVGWILTGFAVSQGSPIWFDLLNKFVNLRGSGGKPAPEKGTP